MILNLDQVNKELQELSKVETANADGNGYLEFEEELGICSLDEGKPKPEAVEGESEVIPVPYLCSRKVTKRKLGSAVSLAAQIGIFELFGGDVENLKIFDLQEVVDGEPDLFLYGERDPMVLVGNEILLQFELKGIEGKQKVEIMRAILAAELMAEAQYPALCLAEMQWPALRGAEGIASPVLQGWNFDLPEVDDEDSISDAVEDACFDLVDAHWSMINGNIGAVLDSLDGGTGSYSIAGWTSVGKSLTDVEVRAIWKKVVTGIPKREVIESWLMLCEISE